MRKAMIGVLTGVLITTGGAFAAVPASAAPAPAAAVAASPAPLALCPQSASTVAHGTGHAREPAQIRSGPSTSCPAPGAAQPSDVLDYYCYRYSQGYTWTYLRDRRTRVVGWIRDDLLTSAGSGTAC